MEVKQRGITLVKTFESLHDGDLHKIGLQPKMCPAGLWTEGYGRLVLDEKGNRLKGIENKAKANACSKIYTEDQAMKALLEDLSVRAAMLNSLKLNLTQNQFDALASFIYNLGFANFKESQLLKKIREGASEAIIRFQFSRWKYSGDEILTGLIKRRAAEADLFFSK